VEWRGGFVKKVQVGKQVSVIKDTFRSDSLNTRNGTDRDGTLADF
jgi:hypothetical protein